MTMLRADLALIAAQIAPGSRVLDVGCGDGALIDFLQREKQVDARGIELSPAGVSAAMARGLSVVQGDADTDLRDFPTQIFDIAVLSQTLQATQNPLHVLDELLRIARQAIVSFPNFGHWRVRAALMFQGRMPITRALPVEWYETSNIHLCTIRDFEELCHVHRIDILGAHYLINGRPSRRHLFANLRAEQGLFLLSRTQ